MLRFAVDSGEGSLHVPPLLQLGLLGPPLHRVVGLVTRSHLLALLDGARLRIKYLLHLPCLSPHPRERDLIIDIVFDALTEVGRPELLQIELLQSLDRLRAILVFLPLKHFVLALFHHLV